MFLKHLVNMGGFELNHHWHGIDMLMVLECMLLAALVCAVLSVAPRVRRKFRIAAIIGAVACSTAAYAANTALSALTASGAIAGANLFYVVQTAGVGGVKATATQVATYINSLFSGDATVSSGGVVTLKNTGPGATGPLGSATTSASVTIDAQGRVTALSSNNIQLPVTANPQTGSNYAIVTGDFGKLVNLSNASAQVPTIAQAGTTGFASGWFTQVCNQGAGTQTITPATSTIGGAATFVLPAASAARPACVAIVSDGTNYQVAPDFPMDASQLSAGIVASARGGAGTVNGALKGNGSGAVSQAACADLSNAGALCPVTPGTGVATAAAANLSAAGGLTTTVASGTSALGTSAISSAACASAVTTSATNTATTDVIQWGFNGDPTAVTGYVPLVAGMLTIIAYPSANNVNFKVCNNTSSSVTPGAITLNWRVAR